jgi:hypothetical protein
MPIDAAITDHRKKDRQRSSRSYLDCIPAIFVDLPHDRDRSSSASAVIVATIAGHDRYDRRVPSGRCGEVIAMIHDHGNDDLGRSS